MSEADPFVLLQGVISDLRSDFRALSNKLIPLSMRISKVEAKVNITTAIILLLFGSSTAFFFFILRSGFAHGGG